MTKNDENLPKRQSQTFWFEDDSIIIFEDLWPRARIHAQCVTKRHIRDIDHLRKGDKVLLQHMMEVGLKVLKERDTESGGEYRIGFHVPPMNSV